MSNLDLAPRLTRCGGADATDGSPVHEVTAGRSVLLGDTGVRRLLPTLGRRLVGAWCFVDHYGPDDIASGPGMQVPPHPHIGLQTVSWLLEGSVHHRDSLGSSDVIEPGSLGLMTAGPAITHAEQSPVPHAALLHGVQLWVALPSSALAVAPAWSFHRDLPELRESGGAATVIMGSLAGATSPGTAYTPLVGVDVALDAGGELVLPLEAGFEHAVLVMSGSATVDGVALEIGSMLYLGCARRSLRFASDRGARVLLLGGEPFDEQILMWWNFVGRSHEEIEAAREDWLHGSRFGDAAGFDGYRLPAPALPPGRLRPGGRTR